MGWGGENRNYRISWCFCGRCARFQSGFGGINKQAVTFRAWSLACSSSRACCFSFSSILLKEMPVEDRELTALDRVDALQARADAHMPQAQF